MLNEVKIESLSDLSNSLQPHGLFMDFPGQNTGVGKLSLLQGIFPTQDQTQVSCNAGGFFTRRAKYKHLKT